MAREGLCDLMMRKVITLCLYRVFDGRRKKWDGARDAIVADNENPKSMVEGVYYGA